MEEQWLKWMRENGPKNLVAEMESSLAWSDKWRDQKIERFEKKLAIFMNQTYSERRFTKDYAKKLENVDAESAIKENAADARAEASLIDLFNTLNNAASKTLKAADDLLLKLIMEDHEIEQICGKALGYPWYKDDQKNFPGATEADGVCTGEHVAVTIVAELAGRYERLHSKVTLFKNNEDKCQEMSLAGKDKEHVLTRLAILADIYKEARLS